jgi:hypothetical protein
MSLETTMKIKTVKLCCAAGAPVRAGLLVAVASGQNAPILYKNPKTPVEQRVDDLLRRMTP